jgi:hypothetical protein
MAKTEKKDKKSDKVKAPSAKVQKPASVKVPISAKEILAKAGVGVMSVVLNEVHVNFISSRSPQSRASQKRNMKVILVIQSTRNHLRRP